jgi:hypothetical protein
MLIPQQDGQRQDDLSDLRNTLSIMFRNPPMETTD